MRFRCNRCGDPAWPKMYEFEGDLPQCDRCGAANAPAVVLLCDVHYLAMDLKGPIYGSTGRQRVACEPNRTHLALNRAVHYAASGEVTAVTCPKCRGTKVFQDAAKAHAELHELLRQEIEKRGTFVDLKPCEGCP